MGNGNSNGNGSSPAQAERDRRREEAVRELPDPERKKLTREDVETLQEAGLGELAELAKRYV